MANNDNPTNANNSGSASPMRGPVYPEAWLNPSGAPQAPAMPAAPDLSRYQGVRGWLLWFCLVLTVFSPLLTIVQLIVSYREASEFFGQFPRMQAVTVIDIVLSAGLMLVSIRAGIGLWRVYPGAVQGAKRYLLLTLAYAAVAAILPFMVGFPTEANEAMFAEVVKSSARSCAFFAVWYTYLNTSKRVRATYGA